MANDTSGPSKSILPGVLSAAPSSHPEARRVSLKPDAIRPLLDAPLQDEDLLLESLVSSLTHGNDTEELWQGLHDAAMRDNRLVQLAEAYTKLTDSTRFRVLPANFRGVILLRAAQFSFQLLNDLERGAGYAQRSLENQLADNPAFELLIQAYQTTSDTVRIAELYLKRARQVPELQEQILAVRGAIGELQQLVEGEEAFDGLILLLEELLKLAPEDWEASRGLADLYIEKNKYKEAARLLERELASPEQLTPERARQLREWLAAIYTNHVPNPTKAISYLEELIDAEPEHQQARAAVEQLLEQRAVAPRAATALARAYQRLGQFSEAASMLSLELRLGSGPRRSEAQRELAVLKQDHLDDYAGARELIEPLLSRDASDGELRERYIALSAMLDRRADAARLLQRGAQSLKSAKERAEVLVSAGHLFLNSGDERRATAAYQAALDISGEEIEPKVTLRAASELAELYSRAGDKRRLAKALEIQAQLEPNLPERHAAAMRLARVGEELADKKLAQSAWLALLDSDQVQLALERLDQLSGELKDYSTQAKVLERRAELSADPEQAQQQIVAAAKLWEEQVGDRKQAILAWESATAAYGVGSEGYARLIPLLEAERDFERLVKALRASAALAEPKLALSHLRKAAQISIEPLQDLEGAFACCVLALEREANHRPVLALLERLLGGSDSALAERVAEVLEKTATATDDRRLLWVVLEWREARMSDPGVRLGLLELAASAARREPADVPRLLKYGQAALTIILNHLENDALVEQAAGWLEQLAYALEQSDEPGRAVEALASLLNGKTIAHSVEFSIACALGEALASAGDTHRAITVLREALAYAPGNLELSGRIEELLAEGASPEERLAFFMEALSRPTTPERQKKLMHSAARVLKRELNRADEAIAMWQSLLEIDPLDQTAHLALASVQQERGEPRLAHAQLMLLLPHAEAARQQEVLAQLAKLAEEFGDEGQALAHYQALLELGTLPQQLFPRLEELAEKLGSWQLLVQVLEARLEWEAPISDTLACYERLSQVAELGLEEAPRAVQYLVRAAELADSSPEQGAEAFRLWGRAVQLDASDAQLARRWFDAALRLGAWEHLPEIFTRLTEQLSSAKAAAHISQAQKLYSELSQPAQAAATPELLRLAELFLQKFQDAAEAPSVHRFRVLLCERAGGLEERAAESFRYLLSLDELSHEDVAAFKEFLTARGASRGEDWRWLYGRLSERAETPLTLWLEWAELESQVLASPERAKALVLKVLEVEPDHQTALQMGSRLSVALGDLELAEQLLGRSIERAHGDAKIHAEIELAKVHFQRDAIAQGASLIRQVLINHPQSEEAHSVIEELLVLPAARGALIQLLEENVEQVHDSGLKLRIFELLLGGTSADGELSAARAAWYRQSIQLSRELHAERALELSAEALREHPGDERLWALFEDLARETNQPELVRDAYFSELEGAKSTDLAELLGQRLIDFHEEWFDEPERVIELLERIVERAPQAEWALDRLKLAFNAEGRWDDLFRVYDRVLNVTESSEQQARLLEEAAFAAKDFALDSQRAVGYLERLLVIEPLHPRAEAVLERLYERTYQHLPLIELISSRLSSLSGYALNEQLLRVARLWLELGDPRQAYSFIVRSLEGDSVGAQMSEQAHALLERIIELPLPPESLPPQGAGQRRRRGLGVRDDAAQLLKLYYQEQGRTADVVRMLEIELETAPNQGELSERLAQLIEIRMNHLEDAEGAFEHLVELVRLTPTSAAHRQSLGQLAEKLGRAIEHAELLEEIAARQSDELGEELRFEAAQVYSGCERWDLSSLLYHKVVGAERAPVSLRIDAAGRLSEILAQSEQFASWVDVLEQQVALLALGEATEPKQVELLLKAAELAGGALADSPRAIRLWYRVLELQPANLSALDGLAEALRDAEQFSELIAVLDQRAALVDEENSRADRVSAAKLTAHKLGQHEQAITRWEQIEATFGPAPDSFAAITKLLEQSQRWEDLAVRLRVEIGRSGDEERRQRWLRQLGELLVTRLGRVSEALEAFADAGDFNAAIQVVRSLAEPQLGLRGCEHLLAVAREHWIERGDARAEEVCGWATGELKNRLLEQGQYQETVNLLLFSAELPFPEGYRRALRYDAAVLLQEQCQDKAAAAEHLAALIAETITDDIAQASIGRLAALYDDLNQPQNKLALYEQQATFHEHAEASEPRGHVGAFSWNFYDGNKAKGRAAALFAKAGQLAEKTLEDLGRAEANYARGAALGSDECLEALARLYETTGADARLAEVLEWMVARGSRESLGGQALRLAECYERLGEHGLSRARLEAALARAIHAAPLRRRLIELYRSGEQWVSLAEMIAEEARHSPSGAARRALLEEAARLFIERVGDFPRAIPLLEAAVEADEEDVELRLFLVDALCAGAGGAEQAHIERAAALLREQIERYQGRRPKARALVHQRLARVLLQQAGGQDEARGKAFEELQLAMRIDPTHSGVQSELGRIAYELGHLDQAERAFQALLLTLKPKTEFIEAEPSRAESFIYLSGIAEQRGDAARAAELVENAIEAALDDEFEALYLERALKAHGQLGLLVQVLEKRLSGASDPVQIARILADLVLLYAEQGASGEGRAERVRERAQVLWAELDRGERVEPSAWTALSRVFGWLDEPEQEALALERQIALGSAQEVDAESLYRLAALRLRSVESRAQGVELLERALEHGLRAELAEQLLSQVLDEAEEVEDAARLLESISRQPGKEALLLKALRRLARLPGARGDSVREAAELALELGRGDERLEILEESIQRGDALQGEDAAWARLELAQAYAAAGNEGASANLQEQALAWLAPEAALELALQLGAQSLEAGRTSAAMRLFEQARQISRAEPRAWEPLLGLYREASELERLEQLISETAAEVDDFEVRIRLSLSRAELLLAKQEAPEAAALLRQILEESSGEKQAVSLLASILEASGQQQELAELLEQALISAKDAEDLPAIEAWSLRLGALFSERGEDQVALDTYRALLDWVPGQLEALRRSALLLERLQDEFTLGEVLEQLLRVETGAEAKPHAERLLSLRKRQADAAGELLALELYFNTEPSNRELALLLAERFAEAERYSDQARVLSQCFEAAPQHADLLSRLITVHVQAGELESALEALSAALALRPNQAELFIQRAQLLEQLGRSADALDDHERAYALLPSHLEALSEALSRLLLEEEAKGRLSIDQLGMVKRAAHLYQQQGNLEAAEAWLNKAARIDVADCELKWRLAQLAEQRGELELAIGYYRQLCELEAEGKLEEAALALYGACRVSQAWAEGRSSLESISGRFPQNKQLQQALFELYTELGAKRELAQWATRMAAAEPEPSARFNWLMHAVQLASEPGGDPQLALEVLGQAEQLGASELSQNYLASAQLARGYALVGQVPRARALLSNLAENPPRRRSKDFAAVFQGLAELDLADGDLSSALESLTKAYEMDPKNGALAMTLGELALDLDEQALASRAFRAVTMMKPLKEEDSEGASVEHRAAAYYHMGSMALSANDPRKAKMFLLKCVAEDPNHELGRGLLEQIG